MTVGSLTIISSIPPDACTQEPRKHASMSPFKISARRSGPHPNHHLWNNHGTWWCHFTLHLPNLTKCRLRRSLGTACLDEAREIRDFLFAVMPSDTAIE
jgi:hypothetical protein